MPISKLASIGARRGADGGTDAPDPNATALAFAFDAGYIEPFKILIYSLMRAGAFVDHPVFIYSDDPGVFEDATVRLVADRLLPVEGTLRDDLYDVAQNHIQRNERAQWNRGTCLKWAVFADSDVEQVLFLDVDMLCLQKFDPFLSLHLQADLVGCAQFRRAMVQGIEPADEAAVIRERLFGLIDETAKKYMGRLNSGVMLVRKRLLSDDFRQQLIVFARSRNEINEQSILTHFFRAQEGEGRYVMKLVSSLYNFHESYLGVLDPIDANEVLARIKILHYPGSPKPWEARMSTDTRLSTLLWWKYRASAQRATTMLESRPEDVEDAVGED